MSEPKLISPMLDGFMMGDPISDHHGVRSCPAMDQVTQNKYIVKIISTPSSPQKLDALLLSGAYPTKEAALSYFKEITDGIVDEIAVLNKLSALEGFVAFEKHQIEPMEDGNGYDVYTLGSYKRTLARLLQKEPLTHLAAVNLGLDLCSALSVCRRSGYLYVDLKPENVYRVNDNGFRIGDIGFINLNSLKYASIPERCLSPYTAPEVTDAYSELNTTIDIYAAGMILYQVFNGGVLPACKTELPAPDYADYEMAEIILKACAADPADRWQDPVEMGQALVSYMQRNGVNDTPIVTVTVPVVEDNDAAESLVADEQIEPTVADATAVSDDFMESVELALSGAADKELPEDDAAPAEEEILSSAYSEDNFGNISFLDSADETLPGADPSDEEYDQISVEISDILMQVDELVAHPTPAPVVAPEAVTVEIPAAEEETEAEAENESDDTVIDSEIAESVNAIQEESDAAATETSEEDEEIEEVDEASVTCENDVQSVNEYRDYNLIAEIPAKPKSHWLRYVIIAIVVLGLLVGGYFFYKNYYLLHVDSITLNGDETILTVEVNSKIDESLLIVVCSDTYGNQRQEAVVDGKAVFTDLAPDSAYTIKVEVNKGFHKLTGNTSTGYTTPAQTKIIDFTAKTGQSDGSVALTITAEGPQPTQWKVTYSADGEESKDVTFTGNSAEIDALTIGKEYTFLLSPVEELFYTGNTEIKHTVSKLIFAEDLLIADCSGGKLVVTWAAPADTTVSSWTVRCTSDNGYDETLVVEETSATFENIQEKVRYNVEVTAAGMKVPKREVVEADAIIVTNFKLNLEEGKFPVLTWDYSGADTQGWRISSSADGTSVQEVTVASGNSAELAPLIPGAKYKFTLQTANGTAAIGGVLIYDTKEASDFDAYNIKKSNIELKMCLTPSKKNWDRYDVDSSDYTTEFKVGEKASFLLHLTKKQKNSKDNITTMLVIRDSEGQLISSTYSTATWKSMWSNRYSEFNISNLPATAGKYTLSVYFGNALAATQEFTVK